MKEIWKDVKGCHGIYQVSNLGRVKSFNAMTKDENGVFKYLGRSNKSKIINGSIYGQYYAIDYRRDNKRKILYIHRMVAESFIDNPKNKKQVNHKDGNKLNNHVENLEWVTAKENMNHALTNGLLLIGEKHGSAVLSRNDVLQIRSAWDLGCFDYLDFSKAYGTTVDNIRHIIKGRSWKHLL